MSFPPRGSADSTAAAITQLVTDSQPATFGRGSEDILDESYRSAKKLDPTAFTTSFHPADFGILEAISQQLVVGQKGRSGRENLDVKAVLGKLNVS